MVTFARAVYRRALVAALAASAFSYGGAAAGAEPWDDDAAVQQVLELRRQGIAAMTSGKRIHRRFTDVFRKENGEWRHDLRHANVISVE